MTHNKELVDLVRMNLCTHRSSDAGDPPCWDPLPDSYRDSDCEARCLRDAQAAVEVAALSKLPKAVEAEGLREALVNEHFPDAGGQLRWQLLEMVRTALAAPPTVDPSEQKMGELREALEKGRRGLSALLAHPQTPQSGASFELACESLNAIDAALQTPEPLRSSTGQGVGEFRCHNCKQIVTSNVAPERCPECKCSSFSALPPQSPAVPPQHPQALEALELADALLRGANMNRNVVESKVSAAIAALQTPVSLESEGGAEG